MPRSETRSETRSNEMRERILETADRLFYGQGIRAVGVDTVAAEIGISKRTLYNYFPSKDELIVAYLSRRLRPTPPSGPAAGASRSWAISSGWNAPSPAGVFRGCPFVNAVAELKEPAHAANKIALRLQGAAATVVSRLCWRSSRSMDPDTLAHAAADPGRRRDRRPPWCAAIPSVAGTAGEAARVLLKAAGVKLPAAGTPPAGGAEKPGGRSRAPGWRPTAPRMRWARWA